MNRIKQFAAAAAVGLLVPTGLMAQEVEPEAPAPEEQAPPNLEEFFRDFLGVPNEQDAAELPECYNYEQYAAKLKDVSNEVFVMAAEYEGEIMVEGKYTVLAAPDTGSWTLVIDPESDGEFAALMGMPHCSEPDHVFHIDGQDFGYPYNVESQEWYGEVFKKPLRHLTSFKP